MKMTFSGIQQLGRALMLPIAVLPAAALLLRFGQNDLLNLPFMASAGGAIFDNLGLLFAIGIAVGFARENNGAAGLAGAIGYFVTVKGAATLLAIPPEIALDAVARGAYLAKEASRMSIPVGIVSGLSAGILYNRFYTVRLPDYLSFFGGRRFVPIVTGFFCLAWAMLFGYAWPVLAAGIDHCSMLITASGNVGLFLYGVLNRLLIVTGLHHIVNNVVWFLHGSFTLVQDGVSTVVTGDLNRFSRGDPTAGAFMAGFFPVMMFGLPAACLAIYRSALPANKKAVGGVLLSMALTAFLTGITEPVEFAFMFLAPPLYAIHALLTGLSLVIMNLLGVKLGFGFSAGFIDYVINFSKSTHPLYLLPVGAGYAIVYYALFNAAIRFFDLKIMGREDASPRSDEAAQPAGKAAAPASGPLPARAMPEAPPAGTEQHIKKALALDNGDEDGASPALTAEAFPLSGDDDNTDDLLAALGGAENLIAVDACATRLRLRVNDNAAVDDAKLKQLGAFGILRPDARTLQIIMGPVVDTVATSLLEALRHANGAAER
jgi:PTS system N-acetylglucosamine-specific IIC component